MAKAYDEFRSELEESEQQREIQDLNETFRKEVTELTEATKMLIKEKEKSDPMHAERRQKFFEFLEQCTSNIFNTNEIAARGALMTPSSSSAAATATASVTACTHKLSKSKRRQMLAAAKKQRGKGTKVTVTRVVGEANGVRRQMIITKHKSTTISISGVFECSKSTCDDPKCDEHKAANADADKDGIKMENEPKVETKKGKLI